VRLLLDTHALLWFHLGDARLSVPARAAIDDLGNQKLVSPASFWELAIKISAGKYALNVPYEDFIRMAVFDNDFEILPVEPRHTAAIIALPFHHKDPFDRLLIAQAMVEGASIVSVDSKFDPYPVARLW